MIQQTCGVMKTRLRAFPFSKLFVRIVVRSYIEPVQELRAREHIMKTGEADVAAR